MKTNSITCPKCGFEQKRAEECARCGIIFRKFQEKTETDSTIIVEHDAPEQAKASRNWKKLFRFFRIFLLTLLLLVAGASARFSEWRTTQWTAPLNVVVWPINGDGSVASGEYISSLQEYRFGPIESFMTREAEYYDLAENRPIKIELASELDEAPPSPPGADQKLSIILWSIKLRFWAFNIDPHFGPAHEIQMFVLYYDPATRHRLDHSLGLKKGLIGIVHAFASEKMEGWNNIVIAHEILHTVGATDKYDLTSGEPIYPYGYAEPDQEPLYPQNSAEIMGSRIPLSETTSIIPDSLEAAIINETTAREIKWVR